MAHTIDAEVRPTRQLFWRLSIVPLLIVFAKTLLPEAATKQFIPDLVFLVGVGLVSLVPVLMYARGTRLQRRGNDLVFVNWRGRGQRVPAADVDLAEWVPFDPSGKRYGRYAEDKMEQRLILRRRSGAQPVMIEVKRFDFDQVKQLFAGCGITVTETHSKSAKQIQERFPGAQFDATERHPVLANFIGTLVGTVLMSSFIFYVGSRNNWQSDNLVRRFGLLGEFLKALSHWH
jgi:hypothetical protein